MAAGKSAKLIGTSKATPREGTQFGPVYLILVKHSQQVPTRCRVHAPSHMRDGIGVLVESGIIFPHQLGIQSVATDINDKIIVKGERDWRFQITLECQVHIATVQDDGSVRGFSFRNKGKDQTANNPPCPLRPNNQPAPPGCIGDINDEICASIGCDAWCPPRLTFSCQDQWSAVVQD